MSARIASQRIPGTTYPRYDVNSAEWHSLCCDGSTTESGDHARLIQVLSWATGDIAPTAGRIETEEDAVGGQLLVLGWHNVSGTWCFPSGDGRGARGMERQFRWLSRTATVVPLDQALQAVADGRPLPPCAVAITFDDGYADTLTLAVPLLQRWRLPATFFLVPGILSGTVEPWWEVMGWAFARTSRNELTWEQAQHPLTSPAQRRAAYDRVAESLKRRNTARRDLAVTELIELLKPTGSSPVRQLFHDWRGARDLVRAGFSIGSHSCHHAILSQETPEEQKRDLTESRTALKQELQVPIDVLAYPNGTELDFDSTTEQAAAAAGYAFAVTTLDGINRKLGQRHQVRRSVIYPERGPIDLVASLANSVRAPGN